MSIQRYKVSSGPPSQRTRYKVRWLDPSAVKHRSRVFTTRGAAEKFEAGLITSKFDGPGAVSGKAALTLAEFMQEWWKLFGSKKAANTRQTYLSWWNAHLDSADYGISDRTLQELLDTPKLIDEFQAELAARTGPQAERQTMGLLRNMLNKAVRWKYIPANPAATPELPSAKPAKKKVIFSPRDIEALRAVVGRKSEEKRDPMVVRMDKLLLSVLAYSGLRPGEALYLRHSHIGEAKIRVEGALAFGEEKETKTFTERSAPLYPVVAQEIESLRKLRGVGPKSLIFPSSSGGYRTADDYKNWRSRVFKKSCALLAQEGEEYERLEAAVPYNLRASCASLLLRAGGANNPARVAKQMGHSILTLFKHYADEIEELQDSAPVDADAEISDMRVLAEDGDLP